MHLGDLSVSNISLAVIRGQLERYKILKSRERLRVEEISEFISTASKKSMSKILFDCVLDINGIKIIYK